MPQEKNVDLRVQKTERALLEALDKLLRDRPFEAITVSDLCDTAMVRRATFYKHFGDKYQFLGHCMRKQESLLALAGAQECSADPLDGFTAMLRGMLRCLSENQGIMAGIFGRLPEKGAPDFITAQLVHTIQEKARLLAAAGVQLPAPPEVAAAFLSGAVMGVAKWWCLADSPIAEDELVESVRSLLAVMLQTMNTSHEKEGNNERKPAQ